MVAGTSISALCSVLAADREGRDKDVILQCLLSQPQFDCSERRVGGESAEQTLHHLYLNKCQLAHVTVAGAVHSSAAFSWSASWETNLSRQHSGPAWHQYWYWSVCCGDSYVTCSSPCEQLEEQPSPQWHFNKLCFFSFIWCLLEQGNMFGWVVFT